MILMKKKLEEKLQKNLDCTFLEIINESYLHKGHHHLQDGKQTVFDGTEESHFRIKIAATDFKKLKRVEIHKKIYEIIKEEMKIIHALAIETI